MNSDFVIRTAREDEWPAAFGTLFDKLPAPERDSRTRNAMAIARQGGLRSEGILLAEGAGQIKGVLLCMPLAGAASMLWPPRVEVESGRTELEDALVQHATRWLRGLGIRLAQAILDAHDEPLAEPLLRNGFAKTTRLLYMRHGLNRIPVRSNLEVHFESFDAVDEALFRDTLMRTYVGTQDCPELNGLRDAEQILAGHRAQGVFHPNRWWLASLNQEPVGILLLTAIPEWHAWDICYLGIVPERRCQGLARALVMKAILDAKAAGQSQLTLSVDERNLPARQLYAGSGFIPYDWSEVFLALWPA